jgi:hypothetical protein
VERLNRCGVYRSIRGGTCNGIHGLSYIGILYGEIDRLPGGNTWRWALPSLQVGVLAGVSSTPKAAACNTLKPGLVESADGRSTRRRHGHAEIPGSEGHHLMPASAKSRASAAYPRQATGPATRAPMHRRPLESFHRRAIGR